MRKQFKRFIEFDDDQREIFCRVGDHKRGQELLLVGILTEDGNCCGCIDFFQLQYEHNNTAGKLLGADILFTR